MRPPWWFRLMRSGVFASACVVLSLAGHDLMAARPAPVWAGWVALAGVTAVGYCLADRRRPAWWILLAVEVVQACLHLWFACSTPADPGMSPRHLVMAMHGGVDHMVPAGPAMPMSHIDGMAGVGMVGAHALAGALVALWLSAGERAVWRALSVIAGSLLGPTLRAFAFLMRTDLVADRRPRAETRTRGEDEASPVVAALRHVLIRRGPPWAGGVPPYAFV